MGRSSLISLFVASLILSHCGTTNAFVAPKAVGLEAARWPNKTTRLFAIDETAPATSTFANAVELLSLSLEKPIGLILEEATQDGVGAFVKEVADEGSAVPYADQIGGARISAVSGTDVTSLAFESIMELLASANRTVTVEFSLVGKENDDKKPAAVVEFAVGTPVTIAVKQKDGPELALDAKVGDNLRQLLIDNGFEVYQGLKQKLGNCGGAGQCTFCAMDFIESEGWAERSEYENGKLIKFPLARLSCLNNVQGPATIRKTAR